MFVVMVVQREIELWVKCYIMIPNKYSAKLMAALLLYQEPIIKLCDTLKLPECV